MLTTEGEVLNQAASACNAAAAAAAAAASTDQTPHSTPSPASKLPTRNLRIVVSPEDEETETERKFKLETIMRVLPVNVEYVKNITPKLEILQHELAHKIQGSIKEIIEFSSQEHYRMLLCIIELFNAAMMMHLSKNITQELFRPIENNAVDLGLQNKFSKLFNEYRDTQDIEEKKQKGEAMLSMVFATLRNEPEQAMKVLKEKSALGYLVEVTQVELQSVFKKLESEVLVHLKRSLDHEFITHIRETGMFFEREPESAVEYYAGADEEQCMLEIVRISNYLNEAIATVIAAMSAIIQIVPLHQQTDMLVTCKPEKQVTRKVQPNPIYVKLVGKVLSNTLPKHLFSDPLGRLMQIVVVKFRRTSVRGSHIGGGSVLSPSPMSDGQRALTSTPLASSASSTRPKAHHRSRSSFNSMTIASLNEEGKSVALLVPSGGSFCQTPLGVGCSPTEDKTIVEIRTRGPIEDLDQTLLIIPETRASTRRRCCPAEMQEKRAALWRSNPFVQGFSDGRAIFSSLDQLLKLYPETRLNTLPYLVPLEAFTGLVGAWIGRMTILNPKVPLPTAARLWQAMTDGMVAFTFSLGYAIEIYRNQHPEANTLSDKTFWGELSLVPFGVFLTYTVWYSIAPEKKVQCFPENTRRRYMRVFMDILTKFLYYGRIFDIFLLDIELPRSLIYQLLSAIPAVLIAFAENFSSYRERIKMGMISLLTVNFMYAWFKNLLPGADFRETVHPAFFWGEIGYWSMHALISSIFVIRHAAPFVNEFVGDPEVITVRRHSVELREQAIQQHKLDAEKLEMAQALLADQKQRGTPVSAVWELPAGAERGQDQKPRIAPEITDAKMPLLYGYTKDPSSSELQAQTHARQNARRSRCCTIL